MQLEFDDFVKAIRGKRQPLPSGFDGLEGSADGLRSLRVIPLRQERPGVGRS